ncbi:MAG: aminopeptidase [Phycisphaerae bacterium]
MWRIALWLVVPALAATGCSDPGYALYAVSGQLALASRVRPLQDVMNDGSLSQEQVAKVQEILQIRDFAANELHLNVGNNYTVYLDTGGAPIAYNLSASAKDSLTPLTWTFPFAGTIPYIGFFHEAEAKAYQGRLVDQGYDTVLYGVESYSTLGIFPDPISTTMLTRSEAFLADLIIHELTHNTVWCDNNTEFNENAASFVGRVGGLLYLSRKYGADAPVVIQARQGYEDGDVYQSFLSDLYLRLHDFYASDLSAEQKIAGRADIFADAQRRFAEEILPQMHDPASYEWVKPLELNNAWILVNARYNRDLSAFQAVYDATGQDFGATLRILLDAAASDDPVGYLRNPAP